MSERVRIDLSTITFGEMADALDAVGDVADLTEATAAQQARANAALAWVVLRRDQPALTYADVLAMPMASMEVVAEGEAVGGGLNGSPPPASLARGASSPPP